MPLSRKAFVRHRRLLLASCTAVAAAWTVPLCAQEASTSPAVPATSGKRVFTPEDFARFAPRSALDMLEQVPGFVIREADQERGFGQASENVLINGQRMVSKSGGAIGELERVPAADVERIEIVDAASLNIAGLSGQVANIILKADKKASGQFSWTPEFRAHFTDPILTRGDISYSGKTGPVEYTLGFNSDGNRSGAGGGTTVFNPDGSPFEFRDEIWRTIYDNPKLSGRFVIDAPGTSVANLNLSYNPYFYRYFEDGTRDRVEGVDHERTIREKLYGFIYEVGGDYAFDLGPGRLKLIGLRKFDHEPIEYSAIVEYADGSAPTGDRFIRDSLIGEWIGRAEYGWKAGRNDFLVTAEGAFNSLDSKTELFLLNEEGVFEEVPFPAGTGRVHEDRYEVLGTWGRPLGSSVEMQLVLGGEYSKLSSESILAAVTRTFFRPKGSVSLAWKASDDFDMSLKINRRVGQLDFRDFLASVNFTDDHQNAGNLNLVPPQSWEVDLEGNRKLGAVGSTSLRLYGRLIDDIVDIVPIGEDGQNVGNIDRATRYGLEWKSTILFDFLGWKGAKLDSILQLERSRVKDPLIGEHRPISGNLKRLVDVSLRHDVPATPWAWGGNLNYSRYALDYRLTEIGRVWEGPVWLSAFVEHKDVAGLTVRATVGNILNARSRWDRTLYAGFRNDAPVAFVEDRNRLIGPIFSLSVRGSF